MCGDTRHIIAFITEPSAKPVRRAAPARRAGRRRSAPQERARVPRRGGAGAARRQPVQESPPCSPDSRPSPDTPLRGRGGSHGFGRLRNVPTDPGPSADGNRLTASPDPALRYAQRLRANAPGRRSMMRAGERRAAGHDRSREVRDERAVRDRTAKAGEGAKPLSDDEAGGVSGGTSDIGVVRSFEERVVERPRDSEPPSRPPATSGRPSPDLRKRRWTVPATGMVHFDAARGPEPRSIVRPAARPA